MLAFAAVPDRCAESYSLSAHLAVLQGALHWARKGAFPRSQLKPSTGQEKLSWERPEARLEGTVGGVGAGHWQDRGRWAGALHSGGGPVPLQVVSGIPVLTLHYRDKFGRIRIWRHCLTHAFVQWVCSVWSWGCRQTARGPGRGGEGFPEAAGPDRGALGVSALTLSPRAKTLLFKCFSAHCPFPGMAEHVQADPASGVASSSWAPPPTSVALVPPQSRGGGGITDAPPLDRWGKKEQPGVMEGEGGLSLGTGAGWVPVSSRGEGSGGWLGLRGLDEPVDSVQACSQNLSSP